MFSSTKTRFLGARVLRALVLVTLVVPLGSATLQGCFGPDESEALCFAWPDPSDPQSDPNECPPAEEAYERIPLDRSSGTVFEPGVRTDESCCYRVELVEGCDVTPGW